MGRGLDSGVAAKLDSNAELLETSAGRRLYDLGALPAR